MRVAVVGAGLMGHGIALSFASAGHKVAVHDPAPGALSSLPELIRRELGAMGHTEPEKVLELINAFGKLEDAVDGAGLVIEAVPERLELKKEVFARIEKAAPPECLLASNTSAMPITSIMQDLGERGRCLGTHWWNPPHLIPLVEVIRSQWTDDKAMDTVVGLLGGIGKKPVRVEKDVPGFIGNRLQHAMWREAISLVEKGVCDPKAIDDVVKSSFGMRLPVLGPLENADLVGTDLIHAVHTSVFEDLEDSHGPSPYLTRLVEQGKLGMRTGQGFFSWTEEEGAAVRKRLAGHLLARR